MPPRLALVKAFPLRFFSRVMTSRPLMFWTKPGSDIHANEGSVGKHTAGAGGGAAAAEGDVGAEAGAFAGMARPWVRGR